MHLRALILAASILALGACTEADSATGRVTDPADPPALGGVGVVASGSGSCSTVSTGAARCPPLPLLASPPDASLPPGVPTDWVAWVGCSYTTCSAGSCTSCSCVASGEAAAWTCMDAGPPPSPSSEGPEVCSKDASASAAVDATPNDPRCPAAWSDLTNGSGYPNVCTSDGLICVYAEGQAECAADGPVLKWWQVGSGQGCSEYPPAQCSPCSDRGTVCNYISGPPSSSSAYTTNYCCDGNTNRWEHLASGGCPNGNVCGTIKASDYDQTCATDTDCAAVTEGDLCTPTCQCGNAAINVSAAAQYEADFEKKVSIPAECPCPLGPLPQCNAGVCQL
jgi:hypothetical protein